MLVALGTVAKILEFAFGLTLFCAVDKNEPRHDKPTTCGCAQLRLRSTWASAQSDQSSLCAHWVDKDPSFLHADSEDSDQTGRMPRLIRVFAGRTVILLVLSRGGS